MFLERMKTTDFKAGTKYVFIVSLGATEQHGPFLPLGTDSFLQDAIIERAEQRVPQAIFLPTIRVSCSREHEGFPGTLWFSKATMQQMLLDVCESLSPNAENIIFVSWHGGNISVLNRFVEAHQEGFAGIRLSHIMLDSQEILAETERMLGGAVDEHAGNSEISMMLACEPRLVSVPPQDYPKQRITNAWDTDHLADVSRDGIIDNHPDWLIDERIGNACIQMAAEELAKGIQQVMK